MSISKKVVSAAVGVGVGVGVVFASPAKGCVNPRDGFCPPPTDTTPVVVGNQINPTANGGNGGNSTSTGGNSTSTGGNSTSQGGNSTSASQGGVGNGGKGGNSDANSQGGVGNGGNSASNQKVENNSISLPGSADQSGGDSLESCEVAGYGVKLSNPVVRVLRQGGIVVLGNGANLSFSQVFDAKATAARIGENHQRCKDLIASFLDLVKTNPQMALEFLKALRQNTNINLNNSSVSEGSNSTSNATSTPGTSRVTTPPADQGSDATGAGRR